jgi:AcrR family transcriptional regulator
MEDGRIRKTRQKLQKALTELLQETPVERLSVTDLCAKAGISRVTFYANYTDKYALVQERFAAMQDAAAQRFADLERENNPGGDAAAGCRNLLDAYLQAQMGEREFLHCLALESNAYLSYAYYASIVRGAEQLGLPLLERLHPRYPSAMAADMICMGLWGFARTALREGVPAQTLCDQAHALLRELLRSGVLCDKPLGRPKKERRPIPAENAGAAHGKIRNDA